MSRHPDPSIRTASTIGSPRWRRAVTAAEARRTQRRRDPAAAAAVEARAADQLDAARDAYQSVIAAALRDGNLQRRRLVMGALVPIGRALAETPTPSTVTERNPR